MQATHSTVLNTLTRVQRFTDNSANALGGLNTSGSPLSRRHTSNKFRSSSHSRCPRATARLDA
jgi:hypothetical protein